MVVNYDLPLLNDQATDGRPDIDTYRHRIGAYLQVAVFLNLLSCQVERGDSAARVSR
jgi:hypothetical protein